MRLFLFPKFMLTKIGCRLLIGTLVLLAAGPSLAQEPLLDPKEAFLHFWNAFQEGDPEQVKPFIKAALAEGLTAEDLKYHDLFPPIIEVLDVDLATEAVAKLTVLGTYVHPYDQSTMGSLDRNRQRFGGLEISEETWEQVRERLPAKAKDRIQSIIDEDGVREIWLLTIPGRVLAIKEDGKWVVDVYHFDDAVMYRTSPQRIILDKGPPVSEKSVAPVTEGP